MEEHYLLVVGVIEQMDLTDHTYAANERAAKFTMQLLIDLRSYKNNHT